jgi:hypothetical protein
MSGDVTTATPEPADGTIVAWLDGNNDLYAVFHRTDQHKEYDDDRDVWYSADQWGSLASATGPMSWRSLLAEMDGSRGPVELVPREVPS